MSATVKYKGNTLATVNNETKTLLTAGKYMEDDVEITDVSRPAPSLQTKSATPSETAQTVTPDANYDGLSQVDVGAISNTYVGSQVPRKSSSDLTDSGATVTVPAGYYAQAASKAVASGSEGTPTATKGTVNNHAVTVTPEVTNGAGYIQGGTHTGTGVQVTAAELVSGTLQITDNGEKDVTNYEKVNVQVSGGGGGGKSAQVLQSTTRTTSTSYTKLCGDMTVEKSGTYNVYWTFFRSSTSGTWGSQLYINGSAYGSAQTSGFSNHIQNIHLTGVSLTAGQKLAVYGRSRGNSYYAYVGQLTIIES